MQACWFLGKNISNFVPVAWKLKPILLNCISFGNDRNRGETQVQEVFLSQKYFKIIKVCRWLRRLIIHHYGVKIFLKEYSYLSFLFPHNIFKILTMKQWSQIISIGKFLRLSYLFPGSKEIGLLWSWSMLVLHCKSFLNEYYGLKYIVTYEMCVEIFRKIE